MIMWSKDSHPREQMLMMGTKIEVKNRLMKGNDRANNTSIPQLLKDMTDTKDSRCRHQWGHGGGISN